MEFSRTFWLNISQANNKNFFKYLILSRNLYNQISTFD